MATNILTFQHAGIRASAVSGHRKPAQKRNSSPSSSSNWWTPLFGWSSEPDYIDNEKANKNGSVSLKAEGRSESSIEAKTNRFSPGCFTEEKARRLRMMTMETETFHDVMYHSAIASRLASDFKKSSS